MRESPRLPAVGSEMKNITFLSQVLIPKGCRDYEKVETGRTTLASSIFIVFVSVVASLMVIAFTHVTQ